MLRWAIVATMVSLSVVLTSAGCEAVRDKAADVRDRVEDELTSAAAEPYDSSPELWFYPLDGNPADVGYQPSEGDHTGRDRYAIDLASDDATIYPTRPGVIAFAGYNCQTKVQDCYGNTVAIDHLDGTYSIYTHMVEKPDFAKGSKVTRRAVLGRVGSSGCSGCPGHVHFVVRRGAPGQGEEVLFAGGEEVAVDVRPLLRAR